MTTITPEQADTLPAEAGQAIDAAEDDNLPEVDSIIFGELIRLPLPGKELRMAAMQVRAALHRHGHLAGPADDHYFAVDYTGCIHEAPDRETAIKWAEDFARTANGGAIGSERPEVAAAIGSLARRAAVPSEQEPVAWVHPRHRRAEMTLDPKALEAAARAICVNPDEVTMGSGSTGSTESETIVYRRAWQNVLPIAQAAITAYLAALPSTTLGETETDATMTTIDVAALNVLADWFDKLPDGGMGKEHFDGLVIVVSELLSRAALASSPAVVPSGQSYARIIEIVNNCVERMKKAGESHAMLAKWISEGVNAASPSPPALDGAGRDAVLEEIAKWLEEQAEAGFAVAEDMPEYSPEGYRLMLLKKWRKADAAAIRSLKETR